MNSFIILNYWLIFLINHVPGTVSMDDGNVAVPGQFKYFVSIWCHHEYLCGGVIINERHVLTVTHCVHGIPFPDLRVAVGLTELSDLTINMLKISKLWFHPHSSQVIDYVEPNKVHWTDDVAMIKVADDLIWSSTVEPVLLLRNVKYWDTNKECEIPGWKVTMIDGRRDVSLRWTRGRVLAKEQYLQLNKNPLPNIEYITAPVLLNKDSGSPLICNDVMTGLIIQEGRTTDEPSTVLKITAYSEFIMAVITNGDTTSNPNELAIVVSIWYDKAFICGGVVIDSTQILTAGHCVPKIYRIQFLYISYIHNSHRNREFNVVPVASVRRHPNYRTLREDYDHFFYTRKHDIAILKLMEPLTWSVSLRPAVFATDEDTSRLYCHAMRWRFEESNTPPQLTWSSVVIIESVNMLLIPNQFVIADGDSRSSSNLKDHGNPVVCNGVVVGIIVNSLLTTASWPFEPTIVLDVIPYIEFMKTTMSDTSQSSLAHILEF